MRILSNGYYKLGENMKEYLKPTSYTLPLLPRHFQKLTALQGLNEETIREAELFSATSSTLNQTLNRNDLFCDGIVIPSGVESFNRARLDVPIVLSGHEVKYLSPTNSKNHPYLARSLIQFLLDATLRLYFTEGEFKSLKATQGDFPVSVWVVSGDFDPILVILIIFKK